MDVEIPVFLGLAGLIVLWDRLLLSKFVFKKIADYFGSPVVEAYSFEEQEDGSLLQLKPQNDGISSVHPRGRVRTYLLLCGNTMSQAAVVAISGVTVWACSSL